MHRKGAPPVVGQVGAPALNVGRQPGSLALGAASDALPVEMAKPDVSQDDRQGSTRDVHDGYLLSSSRATRRTPPGTGGLSRPQQGGEKSPG